MKEQSWWSNNLLPLSVVVLVICGLTAGAAGVVHWLGEFKLSHSDDRGMKINKQRIPYSPPKASTTNPAWGVYGPYMESIEREIKSNWHPPKRNISRRVTVLFKVDRQGQLLKLKVTPSGDSELDESARKAVEETAPFAHLPPASKDKDVDIQFTFDYNVYERNH